MSGGFDVVPDTWEIAYVNHAGESMVVEADGESHAHLVAAGASRLHGHAVLSSSVGEVCTYIDGERDAS